MAPIRVYRLTFDPYVVEELLLSRSYGKTKNVNFRNYSTVTSRRDMREKIESLSRIAGKGTQKIVRVHFVSRSGTQTRIQCKYLAARTLRYTRAAFFLSFARSLLFSPIVLCIQ